MSDLGELNVQTLHLSAKSVILSWRTDECPKVPDTPYLLRTTRGPVIAEWSQEHQSWNEWLGGEHYGTGVNCQVTGWLDVPPT